MPFTPAHILAVTPALAVRRSLPFAALAIGSMVPDFPLFFGGWPNYGLTHSALGAFVFCLPAGFAIWFVWELLLREGLLALAPDWVRARTIAERSGPRSALAARFILLAGPCVVFGAATHIIWDAFTHGGRWGVAMLPSLAETTELGFYSAPNYKLLQYGCSLAGPALLVVIAFFVLRARPAGDPGAGLPIRVRIFLGGGIVGLSILAGAVKALFGGGGAHESVYHFLTGACTAFVIFSLIFSAALAIARRRNANELRQGAAKNGTPAPESAAMRPPLTAR